MLIRPVTGFNGSLCLPGDKSISHRLVLISLLLDGSLNLGNLAGGADVLTSLNLVEKLGVTISHDADRVLLSKKVAAHHDDKSAIELDCRNSGTTARLLAAILAARPGQYRLIGDKSLSSRPMGRVVEPLARMGAAIECEGGSTLPMLVTGRDHLEPIEFTNRVGSAQVKSAILLAGLRARGETRILEPLPSRDHTERLLLQLGAGISVSDGDIRLAGPFELSGDHSFDIPGDISSGAFFLAAAAIFPGSCVEIKNVSLNPGRIRFLEVLRRMGAEVSVKPANTAWEPCGSVTVAGRQLISTVIGAEDIPALVDELPVLAVAMAFAQGRSLVTGATELRHKESDRIGNLITQFRKAGIICEEFADGFSIDGCREVSCQAELDPADDHRMAMAFAILACRSKNGLILKNPDCVKISFPDFFTRLKTCSQA